jgi:hypothetical protein
MSNNHGQVNQSPNRNRDPFEVAKEEFLKTLAADKNIPSRQRATLFKIGWALAMHANREVFQKQGFLNAWPGLNTLAKELAMEKRTIHYGVRTLTALKYLGIALGKQGRGASNSYCLNYKKGVEPTNEKGVEPTPFPDSSGKGAGDAKKESATQKKVSGTHEKGVGPTTDMLNIPDDVPAEEPEHNLYSNRATVGSGTVLGTAPLRSAVSERLPQDPEYDLYKIAEEEFYRALQKRSPPHPQEGEGEDMDTDQPTSSEVSPHTSASLLATGTDSPSPPLRSAPLPPRGRAGRGQAEDKIPRQVSMLAVQAEGDRR